MCLLSSSPSVRSPRATGAGTGGPAIPTGCRFGNDRLLSDFPIRVGWAAWPRARWWVWLVGPARPRKARSPVTNIPSRISTRSQDDGDAAPTARPRRLVDVAGSQAGAFTFIQCSTAFGTARLALAAQVIAASAAAQADAAREPSTTIHPHEDDDPDHGRRRQGCELVDSLPRQKHRQQRQTHGGGHADAQPADTAYGQEGVAAGTAPRRPDGPQQVRPGLLATTDRTFAHDARVPVGSKGGLAGAIVLESADRAKETGGRTRVAFRRRARCSFVLTAG